MHGPDWPQEESALREGGTQETRLPHEAQGRYLSHPSPLPASTLPALSSPALALPSLEGATKPSRLGMRWRLGNWPCSCPLLSTPGRPVDGKEGSLGRLYKSTFLFTPTFPQATITSREPPDHGELTPVQGLSRVESLGCSFRNKIFSPFKQFMKIRHSIKGIFLKKFNH